MFKIKLNYEVMETYQYKLMEALTIKMVRSLLHIDYQVLKPPLAKLKSQISVLINAWRDSKFTDNPEQDLKEAWQSVTLTSIESSTEFSNNLIKAVVYLIDLVEDGLEAGGPVEYYEKMKSRIKQSEGGVHDEIIQKWLDVGNYLSYSAIIDNTSCQAARALVDFMNEMLGEESGLYRSFMHLQSMIDRFVATSEEQKIMTILTRIRNALVKNIEYYTQNKPSDLYKLRIYPIVFDKAYNYYLKRNRYKDEISSLKQKIEQSKTHYDRMSSVEQASYIEHEKSKRNDIIKKIQDQMRQFQSILADNRDDKLLEYDWIGTTLEHLKYVSISYVDDLVCDESTSQADFIPKSYRVLSLKLSRRDFEKFDMSKMCEFGEGLIRVVDGKNNKLYHVSRTINEELKIKQIYPELIQQSDWIQKYDHIIESSGTIQTLSMKQIDVLSSELGLLCSCYWNLMESANIFGTSRDHFRRKLNNFYISEEQEIQEFNDDLSEQVKQYQEEILALTPVGYEREEYKAAVLKKSDIEMNLAEMSKKQEALKMEIDHLVAKIPSSDEESRLKSYQYQLMVYINTLKIYIKPDIQVDCITDKDALIHILQCTSEQIAVINDVYKQVNSSFFGKDTLPVKALFTIKPIIEVKIAEIDKKLKKISDKQSKLEKLKSVEDELKLELERTQNFLMDASADVDRKMEGMYVANKKKMAPVKINKYLFYRLNERNKSILCKELIDCTEMIKKCNSSTDDRVLLMIKMRCKIQSIDSNNMLLDRRGDSSEIVQYKESIRIMKKKMELFVGFHEMHTCYFNKINGLFFSDTSKTFVEKAKKNLSELFVALVFGCFGYQSETTFITILEAASQRCQRNLFDLESCNALKRLIADRARDYPLSKELSDYKDKLESLYSPRFLSDQNIPPFEISPTR